MGEYIKHRNHIDDEEIKIGMWDIFVNELRSFYSINMLKEFKYLDYEDFYAGEFTEEGTKTLDKMIENYNTDIPENLMIYKEIIFKTKKAEKFVLNALKHGEYNILKLYRNDKPVYLLEEYYEYDFLNDYLDRKANYEVEVFEKNTDFEFVPYQYQYLAIKEK